MNNEHNLTYIRWTARMFGIVLLAQIIAFAYYIITAAQDPLEGFISIFKFYKGAAFLMMTLAGIAIAWKHEGLGGILISAGLIGYCLLNYGYNAGIYLGINFTVVPAILFTLYGFAVKQYSRAAVEIKLDTAEMTIPKPAPKLVPVIAS